MKKISSLLLCILICAFFLFIYKIFPDPKFENEFISYILLYSVMAILLIITLRILKIKNILKFDIKQFFHGLLVGLPYLVIGILNLSVRIGSGIANGDSFEPIFNIITFAIAIILGTGFFEEVLCRGIVMNLIFKNFGRKTRKDIWRAVLVSSLIFSICHYSNMFDGDANFIKCTEQVLFTFGFGAVLGAVYARCHNIWAPIFLHGFWDFANMASKGFFGIGKLLDLSADEPMTLQYISGMLTAVIVVLAILCGISAFMLRKKKIHECFEV